MFNVILSISSVYEEFGQATQQCEPVHLEGGGVLHSIHTSSLGAGVGGCEGYIPYILHLSGAGWGGVTFHTYSIFGGWVGVRVTFDVHT